MKQNTKNPNRFYVYEYWRLDKNLCFYVGKGQQRQSNLGRKHTPEHIAKRVAAATGKKYMTKKRRMQIEMEL